jgi:hypothetical protein
MRLGHQYLLPQWHRSISLDFLEPRIDSPVTRSKAAVKVVLKQPASNSSQRYLSSFVPYFAESFNNCT